MGWHTSDADIKTEWDASRKREERLRLLINQEIDNQECMNKLKMVETQEFEEKEIDGKITSQKVVNYYLPKDSSQTIMTEKKRDELKTKLENLQRTLSTLNNVIEKGLKEDMGCVVFKGTDGIVEIAFTKSTGIRQNFSLKSIYSGDAIPVTNIIKIGAL